LGNHLQRRLVKHCKTLSGEVSGIMGTDFTRAGKKERDEPFPLNREEVRVSVRIGSLGTRGNRRRVRTKKEKM